MLKASGYSNRHDGLSPRWAQEHADNWVSPDTAIPIDLHRRLWGVTVDPSEAFERLWAGRATLDLGGVEVMVLGEPHRALALALHVAHHGHVSAKARLDLELGIVSLPLDTWRAAVTAADELGAVVGLSAGLGLLSTGSALRDRLQLEPASRESVIVEAEMWSAPAITEGLLRLGDAKGVPAKFRLLKAELFPSPSSCRRAPSTRGSRAGGAVA